MSKIVNLLGLVTKLAIIKLHNSLQTGYKVNFFI